MRFGEQLLRRDPLPLAPAELFSYLKEAGFLNGASTIMGGLGCAIVGWAVCMGPVGTILYYALRPAVTVVMTRGKQNAESEDPLLPRARRRSTPE